MILASSVRPERGMTLIEIIIGIAIFAAAVIPIIGLFTRGTTFTQENADHIAAMQSCSSYLRSIMALPARDIPLGSPVSLNNTFGSDPSNQVYIPDKAVINSNTFSYRLKTRWVTRDIAETDFWFEAMSAPAVTSKLTAYKRFFRLEFEVS